MCRAYAILAASLACAGFAAQAQASDSLKLAVRLTPEHLGQGTTVGFDFRIASSTGPVPPPLTKVDLRYPGDLGVALSGLGLTACPLATLEAVGPRGCPAEARMGSGSVLAEIAIGPDVISEHATLAVVRAPTQSGHISMMFYAAGVTPVDAQIIFPGQLLPAEAPFGGLLHIDVPLVPSLPEAPDVSVTEINATLGPQHLTYYHHVGGRFVAYDPQGILLPNRCPRGGFPFAAELGFLDGTSTGAQTVVPCPHIRAGQS
jgi:hypothetical protein